MNTRQNGTIRPKRSLVLAGGRPADVVAFEESVVEYFVDAAELLGLRTSVAAVYGLCVANAESLDADEIGRRLDLSVGSIIQAIGVLRKAGALHVIMWSDEDATHEHASARRYKPRERSTYAPAVAPCEMIERWVAARLEAHVKSEQEWLEAIAKNVPPGVSKALRDRVRSLQEWHDKNCDLLWIAKGFPESASRGRPR